jgi:cytochrome c2
MQSSLSGKEKKLAFCCGVLLSVFVAGCSAYNGEKIFNEEGCITCHRFKGTGGLMGPDLTAITQIKSDSSIDSYIKKPTKHNNQSRMPAFGHLSKAKRRAIITFLKN